ncbi:MAG: type II secretion system protein GspG [Pirellulaceae bacterium]
MRTTKRTRRPHTGFTLLEVLLVLAILVVLGGMVGVYLVGMQKQGYSQAAKTQIGYFEDQIQLYKLNTGVYPEQLNDLVVMPSGMTLEKWKGPYLEAGKSVPKDPWGNDYTYQKQDASALKSGVSVSPFIITSKGEDGNAGTEDDITNQEKQST